MEPTMEDFKKSIPEDVELSDFQLRLVEAYLNYRKVHFSGGLRSGRTVAINLMRDYLSDQDKFGGMMLHEEPIKKQEPVILNYPDRIAAMSDNAKKELIDGSWKTVGRW